MDKTNLRIFFLYFFIFSVPTRNIPRIRWHDIIPNRFRYKGTYIIRLLTRGSKNIQMYTQRTTAVQPSSTHMHMHYNIMCT